MATAKVKIKVSSGSPKGDGTVLVRQQVVLVKAKAQAKPYGKPIYQTAAQITAHINRGQRPTKTQLRRAN